MKKHFLLLALATAGALALTFGLAACGGGGNDNQGSEPDGKEPETHSSEVTAEQWNTIMTGTHNYTVKYSATVKDEDRLQVNKVDGDKYEFSFDTEEQYFIVVRTGDKSDPDYTVYEKNGTEWRLESAAHSGEDIMFFSYDEAVLGLLKDEFANFTYSEGKYTCSSLTTSDWLYNSWKNITAVFEDGALVSLTADVAYIEEDDTDEPVFVHMELSSVGTTTVVVPTVE